MPALILGPMLRYIGATEATVWVETDAACQVQVLGHRASTFQVRGHHYALVHMTDLQPATHHRYTVELDGTQVWPEPDSPYPASVIRTFDPDAPLRIAFGSCRVAMPNEPPYTLTHAENPEHGFETDALCALALRMRGQPAEDWPHQLIMIGDQIYADDVSPAVRDFIHSRRDTSEAPGEELADFEEFTRLYRDSWGQPDIRWLLSTIPSAMIFDDHDVNDDWNTSRSWVEDMRALPWWHKRITGAFMSYWIYQHLGNLSPEELYKDDVFEHARRSGPDEDFGPRLHEFACVADRQHDAYRWSFHRDFGKVRLLVVDSRAGRVLGEGRRDMLDESHWRWLEAHAEGDFDHLLIGTSLPIMLAHGIHYLEGWDEAVCDGAWGRWLTGTGERIRRRLDLEHWSAFHASFRRIVELIRAVAAGEHGRAPATITVLSGDVHHVYLAKATFDGPPVKSAVYQAVCSPLRNPLGKWKRRIMRACWTWPIIALTRGMARLAGVKKDAVSWRLCHEQPWFDNQVASLELDGPRATIRFERATPGQPNQPPLDELFTHRLSPQTTAASHGA
ncbi:MAG TPA: alkaline phosphatase D family protein [Rhodanobacteraceae bacterium]|nr:alkaline phosphatase D family protein [Rhodanobacteraceae bacterium]